MSFILPLLSSVLILYEGVFRYCIITTSSSASCAIGPYLGCKAYPVSALLLPLCMKLFLRW
jgi:hypothetical protein